MFVPADGNHVRADLPDFSPTQISQLQGLLQGEGIAAQWAGSSVTIDSAYEERVTSLVNQVRQATPPPAGAPVGAAPPAYGQPAPYAAPGVPPAPGAPAAYGQPYGYAPAAAPTNSNATIALVCAIASWVVCPLVLAIVGIILGRKAQNEIEASGGTQSGAGLAKAAVIISLINIVLSVLFALLWVLIFVMALATSSTT